MRKKQEAQRTKQEVRQSKLEERKKAEEEKKLQQLERELQESGRQERLRQQQFRQASVLPADKGTTKHVGSGQRGRDYPVLSSLAVLYRVAAGIAAVAGFIGLIAIFNSGAPDGAKAIASVVTVVSTVGAILALVLAAESIELFLNMAHDIKNMADDVKESTALLKSHVISDAAKIVAEAEAPPPQEKQTS